MTYIVCLTLCYKIESSNIIDFITILSLQPKVGFRNISAFIPAKWWYIFCILNSISICRITLVRTRNILWLFIIIYWAKVSGDLLRMEWPDTSYLTQSSDKSTRENYSNIFNLGIENVTKCNKHPRQWQFHFLIIMTMTRRLNLCIW